MILGMLGCSPEGIEGFVVTLEGRVADEAGAGVAGASVTVATVDGAAVDEVQADDDGVWTLALFGTEADGNELVVFARGDGLAEGRARYEVNVEDATSRVVRTGPGQTLQSTHRALPTLQLATDGASASVQGRVIDALGGAGLDGVSLSLQEGWNAAVGDSAIDGTTSSGGDFSFTVDHPGMYTISAAPSGGYAGARFSALLTADGASVTATMAAQPEPGQLLATLTWGDEPSDLDLHLSAPLRGGQAGEDGTGRYHVWSGEPNHPDRRDAEGDYEAELLLSDNDGGGPEVAWIRSEAGDGVIRLSAFDAGNQSDPGNLALTASGALMQVWYGEDIPRFYTVGAGQAATRWTPVEIDVRQATVYVVEEYAVGEKSSNADVF